MSSFWRLSCGEVVWYGMLAMPMLAGSLAGLRPPRTERPKRACGCPAP